MPPIYILSSVWVRLSILSQWFIIQSIIQYVGLCVFSLPTPLVIIEKMYILCLIIMIKSKVWTITNCLGLGHETMVCAVCLSIFLWQIFLGSCNALLTDSTKPLTQTILINHQWPPVTFIWAICVNHVLKSVLISHLFKSQISLGPIRLNTFEFAGDKQSRKENWYSRGIL